MKGFVDPYKRGAGAYLIWARLEKRLKIVRVFDERALVVKIPGWEFKPYAGAMNCIWLLKLKGISK